MLEKTTQVWREGIHMVLETIIGGTQGEKAHKIYKEEITDFWG